MSHSDAVAVAGAVVLGLGPVWLIVDLWMHYYARSSLDPGYTLAKPTASADEKAKSRYAAESDAICTAPDQRQSRLEPLPAA